MEASDSFLDSPEGTREEIMCATYLALCEHGYAGLTIQRISAEFPKSKSLIYHHYDGKDELLLDFLEFMLERFERTVPVEDANGADDHLCAVLDHVLATPLPDERREFARAMVELRAQAAHDERYRDHFTRSDRFFRDGIARIIESGVEAGVFEDGDPEATATFLVTAVNGSMTQRVTSDDDTTSTVRDQVETYVRTVLKGDA
ncbi:TetR/AcrR family transcriptional regulator [Haladaptatus sp. NG-WS-4]